MDGVHRGKLEPAGHDVVPVAHVHHLLALHLAERFLHVAVQAEFEKHTFVKPGISNRRRRRVSEKQFADAILDTSLTSQAYIPHYRFKG